MKDRKRTCNEHYQRQVRERTESGSYINKRIKQDDVKGAVEVLDDGVEGHKALRIDHGDGLYTYIFYNEGILYECYTDVMPSLELSTAIVAVNQLEFYQDKQKITVKLSYEYQGNLIPVEQVTYLRSEGD